MSMAKKPKKPISKKPPPHSKILSAYMSWIGTRGGRIGGKKRAENMTAEERTELARKAVNTRWAKAKAKAKAKKKP